MLTFYTLLESHLHFQVFIRESSFDWTSLQNEIFDGFINIVEKGCLFVSNECLYDRGGN